MFFIGIKGSGQYDTSGIRIVFDYLQTDNFKSSLEQISDRQAKKDIREYKAIRKRARSYRKQQKETVLFWTSSGRCFIPSNDYFIPDTSSRYSRNGEDSLAFRRFTKQVLNITYLPLNNLQCAEKISANVYQMSNHILELRHFIGVDNGIKFGYTEILRFSVNEAGKAHLLLIGGIHHN